MMTMNGVAMTGALPLATVMMDADLEKTRN